jgi:16S rRNA A1518/A1519 N6-dimethyltransferase RsmA/KsgA/DIM1 with predicted DNA glycosylase/AP lyase activity
MHDDGHFDATIAAGYDDPLDPMNQAAAIDPVVDVLAELAGDGRALEFAIGTGRIGVPLHRRGVEVHGIELSRAMLEQLRAKEGGADIPVTVGDMTTARADGLFRLVYLVYNTIMNVTTQAGQVAVFRNAAAHLEPAASS